MWPLVLVALATAPPVSTLHRGEDPWHSKGSFGNDTYLPHDLAFERILAAADETLAAESHDATHAGVFSAWNAALGGAPPKTWVRWDTSMHWQAADADPPLWSDRRTEGLSGAILLRQAQGGGALHAAWTHFIEAEAQAALESTLTLGVEHLRGPLAALHARYPGTQASVRAALLCHELDAERGRSHHARSWLVHAEQGARLFNDEALLSAVAARRAHPAVTEGEAWELANDWELVDFAILTDELGSPASGVSGITRWNTDQVFIQSAGIGWTLGSHGGAQAFALRELAHRSGQPLAQGWARPGSAWRHRPSAHGDLVFSVVGRVRDARSNALFAYRPGTSPAPRWSLGEGGWRDAEGRQLASITRALGPGAWEFQPGPIVVDDLLIAQARRWDLEEDSGHLNLVDPARPEALALAFDLTDGALIWRTSLARGSDLFGDPGARFAAIRTPASSAPPPLLCGTSLVFATGMGACVALDLTGGRPQRAVLGRRVEGGLSSAARPIATSPSSTLWIPHGGDAAYELALGQAHPLLSASPFLRPPRAGTAWSSIIGAHQGRPLVALARGGRHQIELIAHAGERAHRSVQLSPGEVLLGAHALGSKRLLTASDQGLFVFDLERQLYLVGHIPLSAHRVCLPEGLVAAGDRLWALTDEGVYRLRVSSGD